ncbi:unnamed protein product [Acanthosepion pharaonis]|uniref:Uncharacterized protein n=1 Tax=Acanthosepion pharaonis TaxID=158019 RepID=A0A812CH87_ACAPH|nr:unnamed protein product [Sepia pharaonis]
MSFSHSCRRFLFRLSLVDISYRVFFFFFVSRVLFFPNFSFYLSFFRYFFLCFISHCSYSLANSLFFRFIYTPLSTVYLGHTVPCNLFLNSDSLLSFRSFTFFYSYDLNSVSSSYIFLLFFFFLVLVHSDLVSFRFLFFFFFLKLYMYLYQSIAEINVNPFLISASSSSSSSSSSRLLSFFLSFSFLPFFIPSFLSISLYFFSFGVTKEKVTSFYFSSSF